MEIFGLIAEILYPKGRVGRAFAWVFLGLAVLVGLVELADLIWG